MTDWKPIETAPRPCGKDLSFIIGYTSWGQQVGAFHEHVGPCEWMSNHYEFIDTDFDVFPLPTHWTEWPAPMGNVNQQLKQED